MVGLFTDLDIVSVAIAVAGTFILGFTVYFSDRKKLTNITFLFFSIVTGVWGLANFFGYDLTNSDISFMLLRFAMFLGVLQSFAVFQFFYVFPGGSKNFPFTYKYVLVPIVSVTAILALSPLVLSSVKEVSSEGNILSINNGIAMPLFGVVSVGLVVLAITTFVKKFKKANKKEVKSYGPILLGTVIMFSCIIIFNFIFPAVFSNSSFLQFGALFTFPFMLLTSYSIGKHKLFNVKVASVAFVAFTLTIFSFFNIIYADNLSQVVLNITFFFAILIGSITLVRAVLHEIEQKEELAVLLKQRENVEHLISHKVKGSFTRSKFVFAEMLEGSFGKMTKKMKEMAQGGLDANNSGIKTVDLILNSFNLQGGLVKYDMKDFDFKAMVKEVINEKRGTIEGKGLEFKADLEEGEEFIVRGDVFWLKEVINNLIENSFRYTKEGSIAVLLNKEEDKVLVSVQDTGVGISPEDKKNLFTEGGRGKDSIHMNPDSTGYGLYSVKLILDQHKGKVWVDSAGVGKGSTFYVQLSLVK